MLIGYFVVNDYLRISPYFTTQLSLVDPYILYNPDTKIFSVYIRRFTLIIQFIL